MPCRLVRVNLKTLTKHLLEGMLSWYGTIDLVWPGLHPGYYLL